jgi:hypothetical protein
MNALSAILAIEKGSKAAILDEFDLKHWDEKSCQTKSSFLPSSSVGRVLSQK